MNMKQITGEEARKILDDCRAVVIDDEGLCYPTIGADDEEDYLIHCEWEDSDFHTFEFTGYSDGFTIEWDGVDMFFTDKDNGEKTKVSPLYKKG